MKKIIFVLIAVVSIALTSCGNKKTVGLEQKNDSTIVDTPVIVPIDSV